MDNGLNCAWCGKTFGIPEKEYRRQLNKGRDYFFCGRSCSAAFGNAVRDNRVRKIDKTCPVCQNVFQSNTSAKGAVFCSRSCASIGSMTEHRLSRAREMGLQNKDALDINATAAGLRSREAWKYASLDKYLKNIGEPFQFEYPIGDAIFDLALIRRKILVEFDSDYHEYSLQQERDLEKDGIADANGWDMERIRVARNMPIHPSVLGDVLMARSV